MKKTTIAISICTAVVATLISYYLTKGPGISHIANSFAWCWGLTVSALTYSVPVWVVLLLCLTIVLFLFWISNKNVEYEPDFYEYRTDLIDGIRWHWKYNFKNPVEFFPVCPECDYAIDIVVESLHFHQRYAKCEDCGWKLQVENDDSAIRKRVRRCVEHRLNTREYVQILKEGNGEVQQSDSSC